MIIFDLDGTLANCEHRRHFVQPKDITTYCPLCYGTIDMRCPCKHPTKPDWQSFYEACDKDEPLPTCMIFNILHCSHICDDKDVHIWSGRCESVRDKTQKWIRQYCSSFFDFSKLKMRPIGDSTPQEKLFLDWSLLEENRGVIKMVFSCHKPTIEMFRGLGIFVFDCNQKE